jgi:Tol biopolymer transport system component
VRVSLALLAALPLLAVGSGATAGASSSTQPLNGLIAVSGGEGITIVDPQTGADTVLSNTGGLSEPAWSPDATRLAVTSVAADEHSVITMKPDGTERKLVLRNASSASWSPDGKQLVVVLETKLAASLAVVNVDGSGLRLLDGTSEASAPQWSPDGKRIAFIDVKGRVVLITPDGDTISTPIDIEASRVSWSPDASKLAYDTYVGKDTTTLVFIAVLDLENGRETTLPVGQPGPQGPTPTWSPEGDQIAFQSVSPAATPGGSHVASELWAMNVDGSNAHNVAPRIAAYGPASWARAAETMPEPAPVADQKPMPADQQPAPASVAKQKPAPAAHAPTPNSGQTTKPKPAPASGPTQPPTVAKGLIAVRGEGGIYLVDPTTAKAHKVPGTADMSAPSWSPDESLLAVDKVTKGGGTSIYTIWPNGSHPQLVLKDASSPSWSPDGKQIFAVRSECATAACDPEDDDANVLYAVNLDGSNIQQVDFEDADAYNSRVLAWPTDGSAIHFFDEESLTGPGSFDSSDATWSPNESELVFAGNPTPTDETNDAKTGLWIVSADGGKPRLLLSGASGRPSWVSQ